MAIFTARRFAIVRRSRAQPASTNAPIAATADPRACYGILTIGPEIALPPTDIAVEETDNRGQGHQQGTRYGAFEVAPCDCGRRQQFRVRLAVHAWMPPATTNPSERFS
jgi:hypothetical protein